MLRWLHLHNVTHPILAVALFIAPAWLLGHVVVGALIAVSFYYGREVRDAQSFGNADHTSIRSLKYLLPLHWTRSNHLDFWPVAGVAAAAVLVLG
jgi:hypothetical protein